MTGLPKPLVPANVDLRDFAFMPLDVARLRDSDLAAVATAEEFRVAVMLWCAAWHQVPAGSLPNDVRALTHLAGLGRDVETFESVTVVSLGHFVTCSDGRLYHPVVCEKVMEAWERKCAAAEGREANRQRKKGWRDRKDQLKQQSGHGGQDGDGTGTERETERSGNGHVPSMTGTGTGTGTGTVRNQNAANAASPDLSDLKTQFFHRGKEVLGKNAGGQLKKLLAAMEDNLARARAALETASFKAEPKSYVAAVISLRNEEISDAESEPINPVLTL